MRNISNINDFLHNICAEDVQLLTTTVTTIETRFLDVT